MGMSAPTFFGGYAACVDKRDQLSKRLGIGVSSGSFATEAALKRFAAKRIACLSPYAQIDDVEVTRFFTEAGFEVVRFKGLRCANLFLLRRSNRQKCSNTCRIWMVMMWMHWSKLARTCPLL